MRFHDSIHDSTTVVAMAAAHTLGKLAKVRDKTHNHHVRIGFIPVRTMRKIVLHSKSGPNPASSYLEFPPTPPPAEKHFGGSVG